MNDLTPAYEAESRQVIMEGRPSGPAGEARLVPVAGVDLAFDRADGHLVRVVVDDDDGTWPALLARLLGPQGVGVLRAAVQAGREGRATEAGPRPLSPEPGLCRALSRLARLDAVRATSPVPSGSPWWDAEAAVLAEQAGLAPRALAEARRAVRALSRGQLAVPLQAAETAVTVADIAATREPQAARRLKESIIVAEHPHGPGRPGLDVAAEVEGLEKARTSASGPQWVLDPAGLFRLGLSPHSDLLVRRYGGTGRLEVRATLVPGADRAAVSRYQAQLVDPDVWRVLARSGLKQTGSQVRAELPLPVPLDELDQTWLELVEGLIRPVHVSSQARQIRRALRWADAALRAERAPAGLAPLSTSQDWAALAALAWDQCRRDWAAVGDPGRAAAVLAPRMSLAGPACLAEIVGE